MQVVAVPLGSLVERGDHCGVISLSERAGGVGNEFTNGSLVLARFHDASPVLGGFAQAGRRGRRLAARSGGGGRALTLEQPLGDVPVDVDEDLDLCGIRTGEKTRRMPIDEIGKSDEVPADRRRQRTLRVDEIHLENRPQSPVATQSAQQFVA
ncbi:MAG TPA: hypothetical protein VN668_08180 [Stellaceae bacterium]|nr:hypothetical protein [Stellaceae bacterium]